MVYACSGVKFGWRHSSQMFAAFYEPIPFFGDFRFVSALEERIRN